MIHTEYDLIKKNNGEHFARALRDANVLELPNIVELVRYAGRDADDQLILHLQSLKSIQILANIARDTGKFADPFDLLHQAGYSFVEYADTLEKQNAIRKYFAPDEELCTFKDDKRYQEYYIVNAVRENIDKIKRAEKPERQDAYGTSVISIQMRKSGGFISIKNRYNHTVAFPDNTFDSNPDNIIPGLTIALKMHFNVDFTVSDMALPNRMTRIGDHIIAYNYEINNMYIGDSFWESHGKIHEIDKSTQIMMDYFYFDIKQNKVIPIIPDYQDCFADVLNAEIAGRRVMVRGKYPNQSLWVGDVCLVEMDGPNIKTLNLPNTKTIDNGFLNSCYGVRSFRAPNLTSVGDDCLTDSPILNELDVPHLQSVGDNFIRSNYRLTDVDLPSLRYAGHNFMASSYGVRSLSAPQLTMVRNNFLDCSKIQSISLPNLVTAGDSFMCNAKFLTAIDLPILESVGDWFMGNGDLTSFNAPRLDTVGKHFLENNRSLKELYLMSLAQLGKSFMPINNLVTFVAPNLNRLEDGFFGYIQDPDSPLKHLVLGANVQWDDNAKFSPQVRHLILENKYAAGIDRVSQLPTDGTHIPPIPTKSKDI